LSVLGFGSPTQDASFEVEQSPWVGNVHWVEEEVEGEWMGDRWSSMQDDQ
jgi:hypothetical protein